MSARRTLIHLAAKAGILFGALFLVSVLLAAIPGHHAPPALVQEDQQSSSAQTPEDAARAAEIVTQLRAGIEKYKDYHVALNEGYKIFLPNLPQPEYHFTKYVNGFLEAFSFDPARPTSLLYKKTSDGYELVGAMYTMPK